MAILDDFLNTINTVLAPVVPAGVTGVEFISVFLIVYTISLLMLTKVGLLSENKRARVLLALIIAYFTSTSALSVVLITHLFPGLGVVTMLIISFLVVISMVTPDEKLKDMRWTPLIILISMGIIALITWNGVAGLITIEGLTLPSLTQSEWYTIIFLGIFIGIILLVYFSGGREKKKPSPFANFLKLFRGDFNWDKYYKGEEQ